LQRSTIPAAMLILLAGCISDIQCSPGTSKTLVANWTDTTTYARLSTRVGGSQPNSIFAPPGGKILDAQPFEIVHYEKGIVIGIELANVSEPRAIMLLEKKAETAEQLNAKTRAFLSGISFRGNFTSFTNALLKMPHECDSERCLFSSPEFKATEEFDLQFPQWEIGWSNLTALVPSGQLNFGASKLGLGPIADLIYQDYRGNWSISWVAPSRHAEVTFSDGDVEITASPLGRVSIYVRFQEAVSYSTFNQTVLTALDQLGLNRPLYYDGLPHDPLCP